MIPKRKKVVKINEVEYILYQFPMAKSAEGYEILARKLGGPLIDIFSGALLKLNEEMLQENILIVLKKTLKKEDFLSLKEVTNKIQPGEVNAFIDFFVNEPEYIKRKGKSINIKEVYEEHGFPHLWALAFEVIGFHYFDFLSQGGKMPPSSKDNK